MGADSQNSQNEDVGRSGQRGRRRRIGSGMSSPSLLERRPNPLPWAQTARKAKSGVNYLVSKISKIEEQSSFLSSGTYASDPTR